MKVWLYFILILFPSANCFADSTKEPLTEEKAKQLRLLVNDQSQSPDDIDPFFMDIFEDDVVEGIKACYLKEENTKSMRRIIEIMETTKGIGSRFRVVEIIRKEFPNMSAGDFGFLSSGILTMPETILNHLRQRFCENMVALHIGNGADKKQFLEIINELERINNGKANKNEVCLLFYNFTSPFLRGLKHSLKINKHKGIWEAK